VPASPRASPRVSPNGGGATASATAGRSISTTSAELQRGLAAFLERTLGTPVTVDGLTRLAGGASRELWRFRLARLGASPEDLVLRRDPPGHVIESSRRLEFELLRAAAGVGVPVPRVRWCGGDDPVLGAAFFVMEFVAGETIGRKILRDPELEAARAALPEQLARAAARIHTMDAASLGLRLPAGEGPGATELARYAEILHGLAPDPHPALELAIRWLAGRMPAPRTTTVVHGDYRIGNVIVGPEGLRAVLDWELVHAGDPMEDLGWLCVRAWRFGVDDNPVGGLCERERLFAAYERASGVRVDPAAVRWWETFGNLKWAVICIMQAQTFLNGVQNVELAALGRRIAEMELELLDLMEAP
jgi:aminoglycoside phosphotransferase (APT) family kinase protein